MIAVIAAGGKGTRLSSIAQNIPKPMVSIFGKPILQHQIERLKENGVTDFYFLIGFLGNIIKNYFKDGSSFGVRIHYIEEKEPLGSGGALFFLRNIIKEDFVFLFGDLIFDVCFKRMMNFHKEHNSLITLLSHPNSHPFDSDLIISDEETEVVLDIDSKNNDRNYYYHNLVNSGIYIISPQIFDRHFDSLKKIDFEKDIVSQELKNHTVYSYHSTEYVKDAGTVDRFYSVSEDIRKGIVSAKNLNRPQKCIFIDRDGTLNKYKGFIRDLDSIELEEGASEGLSLLNKTEYLVIVITNQPVIARGEVETEKLNCFHKKIETLLGKEGSYFDDLFYCPHHPDSGFDGEIRSLKIDCECRKPKIGLLIKAQNKYNIDLSKSYFVGDSTVDIQTGLNAGTKTILVLTGLKGEDGKYSVKPDYCISNLSEIINIIE